LSLSAAGGGQAAAAVEPDPAIVAQLMSMGFGENGSKRAVIATQVAMRHGACPRPKPVYFTSPGFCLLQQ